ncbi:hypothetical protein [Thermococcus sp.]|uniref:hypothetical protein n=1 Tax=Thermococcus sp. TaxID=35749 RepID=UPI0026320E62|nr:hypothetical protein [Thermococcus sp.]
MVEMEWPVIVEEEFRAVLGELRKNALAHDDDFHIIVDGPEGSGKSTLSLAIAKELDTNFDLRETMYWDERQIPQALFNMAVMPEGSVHIFDEAQNFFHRRMHQSWRNITLDSAVKTGRARKQFIIYNTPAFWDLDAVLRRAGLIVHIVGRGTAMAFFDVFKTRLVRATEEARKRIKVQTFEDILNYWKERQSDIGKLDYYVFHWKGKIPDEYRRHKEFNTTKFFIWKALEAAERYNAPFKVPRWVENDPEKLKILEETVREFNEWREMRGLKPIHIATPIISNEPASGQGQEQEEWIADKLTLEGVF